MTLANHMLMSRPGENILTNHIIYSNLKGFAFYIFNTIAPRGLFDKGPNVIYSLFSTGVATGNGEYEHQENDGRKGYFCGDGHGNGDLYGDFFSGDGDQFMTDLVFEEANA